MSRITGPLEHMFPPDSADLYISNLHFKPFPDMQSEAADGKVLQLLKHKAIPKFDQVIRLYQENL